MCLKEEEPDYLQSSCNKVRLAADDARVNYKHQQLLEWLGIFQLSHWKVPLLGDLLIAKLGKFSHPISSVKLPLSLSFSPHIPAPILEIRWQGIQ